MRELHLPALRHSTSGLPLTVRVHTNRHRIRRGLPEVWSVLDAKTGLLLGHTDHAIIVGARFVVQPGGLRRVQDGGKRTVFAWVEGTLCVDPVQLPLYGKRVRFNPHQDERFQCGGRAIEDARLVVMRSDLAVFAT